MRNRHPLRNFRSLFLITKEFKATCSTLFDFCSYATSQLPRMEFV
jgi:hypothetical protein